MSGVIKSAPKLDSAQIPAKLQQAFALHQQGHLVQAQTLYLEILGIQPANFDALYLLGMAAHQSRDLHRAIDFISRAIKVTPGSAEAYYNRGVAYQDLNLLREALQDFNQAITLKPAYAEAYINRGITLKGLDQPNAALASYDQAIALNPGYAQAHYNRGNALKELDQPQAALASYDRAVALNPGYAQAHYNRGNTLKELGQLDAAVASYDRAVTLRPDYAEAFNNRGLAQQRLGQLDAALASYDRAITLKPGYAEAFGNRALVLGKLGQLDAALASCDRAIALKPDNAELYNNRGLALQELRQLDAAVASYDRAIALKPDYAEVYSNRGLALQELGQLDAALASYDRALAAQPDYAQVHSNRSHLLLLLGDFAGGWEEYEWRWKKNDLQSQPLVTGKPRWKPGGKYARLLVWEEQGVGDHVFFGGLLPDATGLAGELIVRVDPRLVQLFSRSMPAIQFLPSNQRIADDRFDCHLPMGSLGRFLRESADSFKHTRSGYLAADKERAAQLRRELCPPGRKLVGISWRSRNEKFGPKRSIDLTALATAIAMQGVQLVNLQYGAVDAEIAALGNQTGIDVIQCASVDNFTDLDGLAALIEACDLVVSADNSTVHMAGALARPTWVLLPFVPDWRWFMKRSDSPWYPTLKLYRQDLVDDWDSVLEQVKADLGREFG